MLIFLNFDSVHVFIKLHCLLHMTAYISVGSHAAFKCRFFNAAHRKFSMSVLENTRTIKVLRKATKSFKITLVGRDLVISHQKSL